MAESDHLDELFLKARGLDPDQLRAFLEELPDEHRQELESLLAHDSKEDVTPPFAQQMRAVLGSSDLSTLDAAPDRSSETVEGASTTPLPPHLWTDPTAPVIPGVQLDDVIGEGGQGVVYHGRQSYLDREVAVKILSQGGTQFAARFQREAKILAGLTHPNIVSCYQAGVTNAGHCYLVMELIEGPNLRRWINEHGSLSIEDALAVCRDLARALGHAYESGIIHRDVKPENVLLRSNGQREAFAFDVKLADLGLARPESKRDSQPEMHLTGAGAMIGTPPTMAPEQFEDPSRADFRTDIYGVGCVLFHMLTGQPAFRKPTLEATIAQKMSPTPPDVRELRPDLPTAIVDLVSKMLAKSPEDRHSSYAELIADCEWTPPPLEVVVARRSRLMPALVTAFVVVLIAVGWILWPGDPTVRVLGPERASEGDLVTLRAEVDGIDGTQLRWKQAGDALAPRVALAPGEGLEVSFTAPESSAPYALVFELVALSEKVETVQDEITIPIDADDDPPSLDVRGPVSGEEGDRVTLSADASDPEGSPTELTWRQDSAEPRVELTSGARGEVSFDLPQAKQSYTLILEVVAEGGGPEPTRRHEIAVSAEDDPPVIELPNERTVDAGSEVTLDVEARDPEGEPVLRSWVQVSGAKVALEPGGSGDAKFMAPTRSRDGRLVFEVTASDGSVEQTGNVVIQLAPEKALPFTGPLDLAQELLEHKSRATGGTWSAGEIHAGSLVCAFRQGTGELGRRLPDAPWSLQGTLHVLPDDEAVRAGARISFDDGRAVALEISLEPGEKMTSRVDLLLMTKNGDDWVRTPLQRVATIEKGVVQDIPEPALIDFVWTREEGGLVLLVGEHDQDPSTFPAHRLTWPDLRSDRMPGDVTLFVESGIACFCDLELRPIAR